MPIERFTFKTKTDEYGQSVFGFEPVCRDIYMQVSKLPYAQHKALAEWYATNTVPAHLKGALFLGALAENRADVLDYLGITKEPYMLFAQLEKDEPIFLESLINWIQQNNQSYLKYKDGDGLLCYALKKRYGSPRLHGTNNINVLLNFYKLKNFDIGVNDIRERRKAAQIAVEHNDINLLTKLLAVGAAECGLACIRPAFKSGNIELFKKVIASLNSDFHVDNELEQLVKQKPDIPSGQLKKWCENSAPDSFVQFMQERFPDYWNKLDAKALHEACEKGNKKTVEDALDQGLIPSAEDIAACLCTCDEEILALVLSKISPFTPPFEDGYGPDKRETAVSPYTYEQLLNCSYTMQGKPINFTNSDQNIGEGAEAFCIRSDRYPYQIFKLFKMPGSWRSEKINAMMNTPQEFKEKCKRRGICWPTAILEKGPVTAGFSMEELPQGSAKISESVRNKSQSELLEICIGILEKIKFLKDNNIFIGDFQSNNFYLKGTDSYFIDVDSYQFKDYLCITDADPRDINCNTPKDFNLERHKRNEHLLNFSVAVLLGRIMLRWRSIIDDAINDQYAFYFEEEPQSYPNATVRTKWQIWKELPDGIRFAFMHTFSKQGLCKNPRLSVEIWLELFKASRTTF